MTRRFPALAFLALAIGLSVAAHAAHPDAFPGLERYFEQRPNELNAEWRAYLERSLAAEEAAERREKAERAQAGEAKTLEAPRGRWFPDLEELDDDWFHTEAARQLAFVVRSYQSPAGGWNKHVDYRSGPRPLAQEFGPSDSYTATFDNDATVPQIRFLARSFRVTGNAADRDGARRGLSFILAAQYPNGGWPQIYPLAGSYHDCITYNDTAMANILRLLVEIRDGHPDFGWIAAAERSDLAAALERGLDCVLATQVESAGRKLGWAQQHHPVTLAPAPARAFEMTSLSSAESGELVELLLLLETPSAATVSAIESAVAWLRETSIEGYRYTRQADGARALESDPEADPIWARFYEIGTNRPLFGDRDFSIHPSLDAISLERRSGYSWYTDDPATTIARYERWLRKRP